MLITKCPECGVLIYDNMQGGRETIVVLDLCPDCDDDEEDRYDFTDDDLAP